MAFRIYDWIAKSAMGSLFCNLESWLSPPHTALLMINVLTELRRDAPQEEMITCLRTVLDAARASGVMVIYLERTAERGSVDVLYGEQEIRPDVMDYGNRLVELMPRAHDPIVFETHIGTTGTKLDTVLRGNSIRTVVVVGLETNESILNITHAALTMNYRTAVVEDCVHSWNADLRAHALLSRSTVVVSSNHLASIWQVEGRSRITSSFVSPLGF